jgi:type IV pilus assembly protein PilA
MESIRDRARSEGGFTLIELLVVMIIISILMAVAVPTFLAQKNNAQKSKATANIKQIVNAVEACSANNTDGTYTGCLSMAGAAGSTPAAGDIKLYEKGLVSLAAAATPSLNTYSLSGPAANPQGYMVSTMIKDGNTDIYFTEWHGEDGGLAKVCSSSAPGAYSATTAPAGLAVAGSKTCTNGKWG